MFTFSDALHLIKNVKNRLKKKVYKYLQVDDDNDCNRSSDSHTRVCPKITLRHLDVDGFSKMNVKLATQVESLMNNYDIQVFTDYFNQLLDVFTDNTQPKE